MTNNESVVAFYPEDWCIVPTGKPSWVMRNGVARIVVEYVVAPRSVAESPALLDNYLRTGEMPPCPEMQRIASIRSARKAPARKARRSKRRAKP